MKSVERRILEFLMNRNGVYVNPHKVIITLMGDYSVHVSVRWPGKRFRAGVVVEYFYGCEDLGCFVGKFGINAFSDLGKIKSCEILRLYSEGDGWLFCLVNEGYLIFQPMKMAMKVVDDDIDRIQEIGTLLNGSQDFINYTRQYYREKCINSSPPHPPNLLSPAT